MAQTLRKTSTISSTPQKVRVSRARLECRINPTIKERAEQAAMLLGQDLTAFTESALNEKAQAVIEREEKIVLSQRDFEQFVKAIEAPDSPNDRLKAAAEAYKATRSEHPEANW